MAAPIYLRVCDNIIIATGGGQSCQNQYWVEIDPSLLTMKTDYTADDLSAMFNGVAYIVALIFIIGLIKKAIEQ